LLEVPRMPILTVMLPLGDVPPSAIVDDLSSAETAGKDNRPPLAQMPTFRLAEPGIRQQTPVL